MISYWKIAIVGSGPAGFYSAAELLKQTAWSMKIDMFERLPTPFGLVRGGVAPDHQQIKSVQKIFTRIAENNNFRYFGNVEFGRDVFKTDLLEHYDAIIYAVGCATDRTLEIPGENLLGCHSASEFVAWYNGHPDYSNHKFDLSSQRAIVIGNGNVALDVARILVKNPEELAKTDIADNALEELRSSQLEEIWLLGRRGPLQAAFSPIELKEFLKLSDVDLLIDKKVLELDAESRQILEKNSNNNVKQNFKILKEISEKGVSGKKRRVHFMFLTSPIEIFGNNKVERISLVSNQLIKRKDGNFVTNATKEINETSAGLVFRSIGYHGMPLLDLPFNQKTGTIPNERGQVKNIENENLLSNREYVAGWIKRGASGVIGTNKKDAVETVHQMLTIFSREKILASQNDKKPDITKLLEHRKIDYVSFADWKLIDQYETQLGIKQGRPRVKITSKADMLAVISKKN